MPLTLLSDYTLTGTVGNSAGVVVSPDGAYVYVNDDTNCRKIQISDMSLINTYAAGTRLRQIAVDPSGSYVYVSQFNDTFAKVQTSDMTSVGSFSVTATYSPRGVAIDETGTYLYGVTQQGGTIYKISTSTMTSSLSCALGVGTYSPLSIAYAPDGYVYVAKGSGSDVKKIRTSDMVATATCTTTGSPGPLATSPSGHLLYILDLTLHGLYAIRTSDMSVYAQVSGFGTPNDLAVDPKGVYAWVTRSDVGNYSVIYVNLSTMTIEETNLYGSVLPMEVSLLTGDSPFVRADDNKVKKNRKDPDTPAPISVPPFRGAL